MHFRECTGPLKIYWPLISYALFPTPNGPLGVEEKKRQNRERERELGFSWQRNKQVGTEK